MTDTVGSPAPARPRWLRPLLILYTIAAGLLLIPAGLMALMSPMLSDSGVNFYVWALIAGFALAPILLLASVATAWIGYGTKQDWAAIASMCVPLVWLVYIVLGFVGLSETPPHQ